MQGPKMFKIDTSDASKLVEIEEIYSLGII